MYNIYILKKHEVLGNRAVLYRQFVTVRMNKPLLVRPYLSLLRPKGSTTRQTVTLSVGSNYANDDPV
jgi:hypothetical protein